jgi:anti-sigma regulatory factor (Ser/Thr protein kinase)
VLAGHLPPVLCHDGLARTLDLRIGVPLGVRGHVTYIDTTFLVPAGSALLLFTDGLVEDRRFPIAQGLAQLRAALTGVPVDDPEELLQRVLLAGIGPQPRSDDVALLAISTDPGAEPAVPAATRLFRSDASSAASARRFAADILTAWGMADLIDNARLLLGEVITNAVQYTVGDVRVRLARQPDRLRVEVHDGSVRRPALRAVDPDSESGRGLQIVASLADAWGHRAQESGGKVVWFELVR